MPITVNVFVVTVYLLLGGLIFSNWEGWQFYSAVYFSFVTLSTIGFGDLVPGTNIGQSATVVAVKMMVTNIYTIFGENGEKHIKIQLYRSS